MKLDKINKTYVIAAIFVLLFIVLAVVFIASRTKVSGDPDKITIQKDDGTLVVGRSGQVTYTFGNSVYIDQWDQDKTNTFFDYIYNKYANSGDLAQQGFPDTITFTLNGEETTTSVGLDELVDVVIDDTINSGGGGNGEDSGGDGGDEDEGEDVGDYFNSPTPVSSPTSTFGPSPSPTPYDPHPGCLYWKLSYCAVARPTAPPSTPAPEGGEVIEAADCEEWNTQQGDNTIINNTVCIPD